jgi:hypothetical protein
VAAPASPNASDEPRAAARDARDWVEEEAPVGGRLRAATARLLRRAGASWPWWVAAALLAAGAATYALVRTEVYEVSVVLRVDEGTMETQGRLSPGALETYVKELSFTNTRLLELMRKHPGRFPGLAVDPGWTLDGFRERVNVTMSENDFVEERGPGDPPRSARLTIAFRSIDPEFAWTMARELSDVVIGSTLAGQKATLERERAAAQSAVRKAEEDAAAIRLIDPMGEGSRAAAARRRLVAAQQSVAAAELALRAASEHQTLRFEVVDPGRPPPRRDPVVYAGTMFALMLAVALAAASLLAGAFDPRVLDAEDLAAIGVTTLGDLPALPR